MHSHPNWSHGRFSDRRRRSTLFSQRMMANESTKPTAHYFVQSFCNLVNFIFFFKNIFVSSNATIMIRRKFPAPAQFVVPETCPPRRLLLCLSHITSKNQSLHSLVL
ncbi:hypothetical protein M408DRAFT_220772 [Serendipita vermifera MAFF 305830]|uniref:Uncharacterized protein n=1 Tax=Serendipita vermifera MAFF 305830 TaxID=933852 RepID=A0A0C3B0Y7_SERVB|nr:hypothetical protein M408DRAFT_220772 [Serendipita vermifera MAFF 305830]